MRIAVCIIALASLGCAATPKTAGPGFSKVKDYHLQDSPQWQDEDAGDPMIPFERKYLLYGAVTKEEREARSGHYYTFFWTDIPVDEPLTFRFEYRQALSGEDVHRLELNYSRTERRNRTRLEIVGTPYRERGRVVAWRASLWRTGTELAATQSFLW